MRTSQANQPVPSQDPHTLLIVDDEVGVIDAIRESLCELNYHLISTTDPQRALEIIQSGSRVDVLITDLFMPSMDGATLLKQSRQVLPGLKAVLTTGAASPDQLRRWRARGELVVMKPWLEGEFADVVGRALKKGADR